MDLLNKQNANENESAQMWRDILTNGRQMNMVAFVWSPVRVTTVAELAVGNWLC